MTENETPQDYSFEPDLPNNIMTWLDENKDLPTNERIKKVKLMLLERANFASLLDWAAQGFMLSQAFQDYNDNFSYNFYNTIIQTETRIQGLEKDRKKKDSLKANNIRTQNYGSIKEELKEHWENNIDSNKRATDAAILLERSNVYEKSNTKPKRSTLETYIREWQRLRN